MPKVFNVNFPDNLGNNQEEVIKVLCNIALFCSWPDHLHAYHSQGCEYVLDRNPREDVMTLLQLSPERPRSGPICLGQVRLKSARGYGNEMTMEYEVKPNDLNLFERILREAVVACVGDRDGEFFRPVYPEPECYRIIQEEGQLPRRLVTQAWQRWYFANRFSKPMAEAAFEKMLAGEFAAADHEKKEFTVKPGFTSEGEFEILIYHVERTRV